MHDLSLPVKYTYFNKCCENQAHATDTKGSMGRNYLTTKNTLDYSNSACSDLINYSTSLTDAKVSTKAEMNV